MNESRKITHTFYTFLGFTSPFYTIRLPLYSQNCTSSVHMHFTSTTELLHPTHPNQPSPPIQNPKRSRARTNLESGDEAPAPVDVTVLHMHHAARVEEWQRIQRLNNHRANAGLERTNRGLVEKMGMGKGENRGKSRNQIKPGRISWCFKHGRKYRLMDCFKHFVFVA
jgi:hypothetical protein